MFNLFLQFSVSDSTTCQMFDFLPDTCATLFGCGYCEENDACVPEGQCEAYMSIYANNAQPQLGLCGIYNDDGCSKCVSNHDGMTCGWIQSIGICVEGNKSGPYGIKANPEDWLFNKTRCRRSTCASIKTESKCVAPCRWSKRQGVCKIPRTREEMNGQVPLQVNSSSSTRFIVIAAIMFVVVCAVAIIGFVWKHSKPLYGRLPNGSSKISLDDLPKAH